MGKKADRSEYFSGLSPADQKTYRAKLEILDYVDPYSIAKDKFASDHDTFPDITYIDIVNYFVLSPTPIYTASEMKLVNINNPNSAQYSSTAQGL